MIQSLMKIAPEATSHGVLVKLRRGTDRELVWYQELAIFLGDNNGRIFPGLWDRRGVPMTQMCTGEFVVRRRGRTAFEIQSPRSRELSKWLGGWASVQELLGNS